LKIRVAKPIKSTAYIDYVCQIHSPGEIAHPPTSGDYAFGTFVRVLLGGNYGHLVGVIYDTVLFNPDFVVLDLRFSSTPDPAIFSLDHMARNGGLILHQRRNPART
jgi:hypothetical protein